jgi:hypothetical protein
MFWMPYGTRMGFRMGFAANAQVQSASVMKEKLQPLASH